MIPIIDSHHHIWRQEDLPWLKGPMLPRIFGPYEAIRRDYTIEEYLDDVLASGVVKSVYVQANWPKDKSVGEAKFVQAAADSHGFPHAIAAYADLLSTDAPKQLDALKKIPLVRGIRMQLHWHENPLYRFAAAPDIMNDPVFRQNFHHLQDFDFTFDLQVFTSQMDDAANLAMAFPKTTFILQHAGMLEDTTSSGREAWRTGMLKLAACPNIVSKLSGLGTFIHCNDTGHISDVVAETVAMFCPLRCMFGSNFPIEKLWCEYNDLVSAYRSALAGYSDADQKLMLHDNAARIYSC